MLRYPLIPFKFRVFARIKNYYPKSFKKEERKNLNCKFCSKKVIESIFYCKKCFSVIEGDFFFPLVLFFVLEDDNKPSFPSSSSSGASSSSQLSSFLCGDDFLFFFSLNIDQIESPLFVWDDLFNDLNLLFSSKKKSNFCIKSYIPSTETKFRIFSTKLL